MPHHKSIQQRLHSIAPGLQGEANRWHHQQRNRICKRFGIATKDYESLCHCEQLLHRWHEAEQLGFIQRDDPTGIPWSYEPDEDGTPLYRSLEPLRDHAKESAGTAQQIAARYGLRVHIQTNPSDCALHLYKIDELAGRDIQDCFLSCGVAVQYPRHLPD